MTDPVVDRHAARRAEEVVRAVLPRSVAVRRPGRRAGADLIVGGAPIEIKWVGEGWLRDVRPLLASARRPDVVVARQMSPGAREVLSEAGIGWADETGAAEIATGSMVVSRSGRPPKSVARPDRWTPTVMAIAEALLCGVRGTVAAVQEATHLSSGSCTNALKVLTNLGLLAADAARGRGSARRVADPDELLEAYASATAAMPHAASLPVGVTWRDMISGLASAGQAWDRQQIAWVATGAAAASVMAPISRR